MKWSPTPLLFLLLLTGPSWALFGALPRRPSLHFGRNARTFEKSIHSIYLRLHQMSDRFQVQKTHIETGMNSGLSRLEALNIDSVLDSHNKATRL